VWLNWVVVNTVEVVSSWAISATFNHAHLILCLFGSARSSMPRAVKGMLFPSLNTTLNLFLTARNPSEMVANIV